MVSGVKLQEVEMTEVILISFYTQRGGQALSFIENNCSDNLTSSWTQPGWQSGWQHHIVVTCQPLRGISGAELVELLDLPTCTAWFYSDKTSEIQRINQPVAKCNLALSAARPAGSGNVIASWDEYNFNLERI